MLHHMQFLWRKFYFTERTRNVQLIQSVGRLTVHFSQAAILMASALISSVVPLSHCHRYAHPQTAWQRGGPAPSEPAPHGCCSRQPHCRSCRSHSPHPPADTHCSQPGADPAASPPTPWTRHTCWWWRGEGFGTCGMGSQINGCNIQFV